MCKEEFYMNEIIEVVPDKNGRLFVTIYGVKYEIKIKDKKLEEKEKK